MIDFIVHNLDTVQFCIKIYLMCDQTLKINIKKNIFLKILTVFYISLVIKTKYRDVLKIITLKVIEHLKPFY